MTKYEESVIIGQVLTDHVDARRYLAVLQAKAGYMAESLRNVALMLCGEVVFIPPIDSPSAGEISVLISEIAAARHRLDALAVQRKNLGF